MLHDYIGRTLGCACLLLILLLPLSGCYERSGVGAYYTFAQPAGGVWPSRSIYRFDLLFPARTTSYDGQVILRMDSRLDRPKARVEVRLSQEGELLRRDTLQAYFASEVGAWKRPGAMYHEFVYPLARSLQAPYAGLFSLEVRLLDTLPLRGVAAIGLHTTVRHP